MKKATAQPHIITDDMVMTLDDISVIFGGDPIKKGTHLKVVNASGKHFIEVVYKGRYFDVSRSSVRLVNPHKIRKMVTNQVVYSSNQGKESQLPKGWIGTIQSVGDEGIYVSLDNHPVFVPESHYDLYEGTLDSGIIKLAPLSSGDTIEIRTHTGEGYKVSDKLWMPETDRLVVGKQGNKGVYVSAFGMEVLVLHGYFKRVHNDATASCPVEGTETPSKPLVKDFIKVGDYVRMDVAGGVEIGGITIMEGCTFEVTGVEDDKLQIEVFMDKFIYVPTKYFVQIPKPTRMDKLKEAVEVSLKSEPKRKPELERPERGYFPKLFWLEDRLKDIDHAINRRIAARQEIPAEWITERNELVLNIKKEDEHGIPLSQ